MSDLQETLAALDAVLPSLPARLTAPIEIGESLERATEGFLRQLQQKESSAVERVDTAQHAFTSLGEEATQVEAQLDREADVLESLLQEHSQTFAHRREELENDVEAARQAMDALQQHLVEAGTAAQAAQDEVAQALTGLEHTMEATQQELRASVDATLREVELLEVGAESARVAVEEDLHGLRDLMTNLASGARDRLQQVAQDIERVRGDHDTALEAQGSALQAGQADLLTLLKDTIDKELRTRLMEAASAAAERLKALADDAHQEAQTAAHSRADLESALDGVRDEGMSIMEAVSLAKDAVEIVGLVWGI